MDDVTAPVVLAVNAGSGTLSATAYRIGESDLDEFWQLDVVRHTDPQQITLTLDGSADETTAPTGDLDAALRPGLLTLLETIDGHASIGVVGHRIVHGGEMTKPVAIDTSVRSSIEELEAFAPLHNSVSLEALDITTRVVSDARHVAVFDTMFHATVPHSATTYGGPLTWLDRGLHRYGFHGISHHDAAVRVATNLGRPLQDIEIISVHLGGGCSATAIRHGRSVDTTMGLTPTAGMVMATRSGSVDPGLLIHLLRHDDLDADGLEDVLNRHSGLMGLTDERTGDIGEVRRLADGGDDVARLAEDVYVHAAAREIAALRPSLDDLTALVFTGSAVEPLAWLRRRIVDRLVHLGATIDPIRNELLAGFDVEPISAPGAPVEVFAVEADENRAIARHALTASDGDA